MWLRDRRRSACSPCATRSLCARERQRSSTGMRQGQGDTNARCAPPRSESSVTAVMPLRMRPILSARKAGAAAITLLAVAYALPTPAIGWNQTAHYALVRALADGTPRIDRTRHEVGYSGTGDVSKIGGHY